MTAHSAAACSLGADRNKKKENRKTLSVIWKAMLSLLAVVWLYGGNEPVLKPAMPSTQTTRLSTPPTLTTASTRLSEAYPICQCLVLLWGFPRTRWGNTYIRIRVSIVLTARNIPAIAWVPKKEIQERWEDETHRFLGNQLHNRAVLTWACPYFSWSRSQRVEL